MCRSLIPVVGAIAVLAACASDTDDVAPTTATSIVATAPPTGAPTTSATPAMTATTATRGADVEGSGSAHERCSRAVATSTGTVVNAEITEASGLVASRAHPGVYWAHNDGDDARLFAIGADGRDLGAFALGAAMTDLEDIAVIEGIDGADLLLADIGDNGRTRPSVQLLRLREPDPSSPGEVGDVVAIEFVYPDGPHNAETVLVDEANETFVVVTKEQDESTPAPDGLGATLPALVFEGSLDAPPGPVELVLRGTIDLPALASTSTRSPTHPAELFDAAGVATGGDVSADGSLVALRTYQTVWLWDRADGESVADALLGEPCEVAVAFEAQGEAVAFDGDALITVGEGASPLLHRLG